MIFSLAKQLGVARFRAAPRVVKVLSLQQFLEGFVPIMALYAIMFERVGGLTFEQIGLLFSIWSLGFLVTELPSGVLADYWSRKYVIMLGGVLRAVGLTIWIVWPTFTGYAVGFALWGMMIACVSGSVTAYLHTELGVLGKGKKYAKYYGWTMSARWLGTLLGYVIASVLTLRHTNALIGLSIAGSLLSAAVLITLPEHPYKKQDSYLKTLAAGLSEIVRSKKLRYMCYGLFSIYMVIGVIEELLPRLYANFGLNDSAISIMLAVALIVTVLLLTRLESFVQFSLPKQMLCMVLAVGLLLGGLHLGGFDGSFLILLFSLIFQLFRPVFQHHVQEAATGNERATVGSVPGLVGGIVGALAYIVIGKGAEFSNERLSIGAYGTFWLAVFLLLAYMGRKYRLGNHHSPVELAETGQPTIQF